MNLKLSAGGIAALRLALLVSVAGSPAMAQGITEAEPAVAATALNRAGETTTGEDGEIIVSGERPIRESERAALLVQKNSDQLVSVLSSDSVGRLPDQNIAQAVSRLPGVAVQRDQGQARYINLRG